MIANIKKTLLESNVFLHSITNNFIVIKNDDESFDYFTDYKILDEAIKDSNKLIIDNSKENEIIDKVFTFSNYLRSCYEKIVLEKDEKIASSNLYFEYLYNNIVKRLIN